MTGKGKKAKVALPPNTKACPWSACLLRYGDDGKGHQQQCTFYMRVSCNYCTKRALTENEMVEHLKRRHAEHLVYLASGKTGFTVDKRTAAEMLQDAVEKGVVTLPLVMEDVTSQVTLPAPIERIPKRTRAADKEESDDEPTDKRLQDGEELEHLFHPIYSDGESVHRAEGGGSDDEQGQQKAASVKDQQDGENSDSVLHVWKALAEERLVRAESLQRTVDSQQRMLEFFRARCEEHEATAPSRVMVTAADKTTAKAPVTTSTPALSGEMRGRTPLSRAREGQREAARVTGERDHRVLSAQREETAKTEASVAPIIQQVLDALQATGGLNSGRRHVREAGEAVTCYSCGGRGHYASACPNNKGDRQNTGGDRR